MQKVREDYIWGMPAAIWLRIFVILWLRLGC